MPTPLTLPLLDALATSHGVLVAGCGGGFDIYAGIPLALALRRRGQRVVLANLSFSDLPTLAAAQWCEGVWEISPDTRELPYFSEKWLAEWLLRQDETAKVLAFAKTGAAPLRSSYEAIIRRHEIDAVVLIDGGTDSLIFGDEPGVGTVVEDAVSLTAVGGLALEHKYLACLGFGIDHFHGVSHHAFLENTAQMVRDGGFMGAASLLREMDEVAAFLDLVDFANQRQPDYRSIVCNSIASALRGEFGDHHATDRTAGQALFINPLMSQYWCYSVDHVIARMHYATAVSATNSFRKARLAIEAYRMSATLRPRQAIPL